MKAPIRVRLAFWYTAIVAFSLLAFGIFTYYLAENELHSNLDASLVKVANSLDDIIKDSQSEADKISTERKQLKKEKIGDKFSLFRKSNLREFVGPLRPAPDSMARKEEKDIVWSAVYEHILLNPRNYFIQIADTDQKIIWRSKNLQFDSLGIPDNIFILAAKDSLPEASRSVFDRFFSSKKQPTGKAPDSVYLNIQVQGQQVRLLVKRTENAIISVGYSLVDIQSTLNQLFSIFVVGLPLLLAISTLGGLFLSKFSLRPVEEISRLAQEITARNLSRRLKEPNTNDEIGHLTKTINNMIERLDASFSQIKQFTSDASHELRTPLTILRGELEIALNSKKTISEYELVIASALEEVVRLSNVVETLLELSRADAGQVKMTSTKSNISKLLADISEDAEILASAKDIEVNTDIDRDVIVDCDPSRLHQAFLNVIDNAIKYSPHGRSITVSLKRDENFAFVRVSDTGIGIPEEQLPYIFDRFYRVDRARSKEIQGTGLGLSIVKWIIEAHDGVITAESQLNKGTTFVIKLPIVREDVVA